MKLDAHQHFWKYDARRDAWIDDTMLVLRRDFLPNDLLPELRAHGIDATIAVQADQSDAETEFLLGLAELHSFIAAVVGWVDLRAADIEERLQRLSQHSRLAGFRHIVQAEPDDRFLLDDEFVRGLSKLAAHRFTYDLLVYPRQLAAAVELAAKLPQQAFVLDHIAKPPIRSGETGTWREHIRELAQSPNVYCKLSGMVTEADWKRWRADNCKPYLDVVFEAFGPDRLMFGSDWPVCLLAASYGQVKHLVAGYAQQFAQADRDKIMGENAARFYGVKAAAWTCN